jgi:hypothetical protein
MGSSKIWIPLLRYGSTRVYSTVKPKNLLIDELPFVTHGGYNAADSCQGAPYTNRRK